MLQQLKCWPFVLPCLRSDFVTFQFVARCRGDGAEEICEARVWWRDTELLLWGGLHLWEHRERAVLLHFTGSFQRAHSHKLNTFLRIHEFASSSLWYLQERQSIIKYWLDNLRAKHGEVLHNINFLEGQPISESSTRYRFSVVRPSERFVLVLMKAFTWQALEVIPLLVWV